MENFPTLNTSRLILNHVSIKDIPNIIEYAGNIKVAKNTLNIPHPYKEEDAVFWINSINQGFVSKTQYSFGIRPIGTKELIGGIGLRIEARFDNAELGYWIAEPFWNQGYATEAVECVLKFGFVQLNLNKIFATHIFENPASGKVMIKNGMIKEAELKDHVKRDGQYRSLIQYRLTNAEYFSLTRN